MVETTVQKTAESVIALEKLTNGRSAIVLAVAVLLIDIGLVLFTGKNLVSYPWAELKNGFNYGLVALAFLVALWWYVFAVHFLNEVCWRLFRRIAYRLSLAMTSEDDVWPPARRLNEEFIDPWVLSQWAVTNGDSMALSLAQVGLNKRVSTAELNHAVMALLALLTAQALMDQSVYQWVMAGIQNEDLQKWCALIVFGFLSYIWWITKKIFWWDEAEDCIYYPKAKKSARA